MRQGVRIELREGDVVLFKGRVTLRTLAIVLRRLRDGAVTDRERDRLGRFKKGR